MPDGPPTPGRVELVPVDDEVLARLVTVATTDAAPDEVTPSVTPGPVWTPQRIDWLREFHRDRRAGLDGPQREATWAVVVGGAVAGAVRLRRTAEPGAAETGIWLARSGRGRGVAGPALAAVVGTGRALGLTELRAETTSGNAPALAVLRAAGFCLAEPDADGRVAARMPLGDERS